MSGATVRTASLPMRSILQMLAAMLCFAIVDALAKAVTTHYPANEVTFFRMIFGLVPALVLARHATGSRSPWRPHHWRPHIERAIALMATLGLFFAGLRHVPLGEAVALAYTETLFIILLAPLVLKEAWRRRDLLSATFGFAGILLVVRPWGEAAGAPFNLTGPVLILLSALCGALSVIQIKRIDAADDPSLIVLYSTLIGTVVTGFSLLLAWRTPTLAHLGILVLLGVAAGTGQLLMTMAFRHADVAMLAPCNYTSIVWATLFGYVIWGESIGWLSFAGIALIVGSSIAVAVRRQDTEGPVV
ncbi:MULTISPECIES: DMT family transporter [Paraburkholderia]|uniref:DMT family transporter n=1 Tax=Paraburkholderia TaxID=1822464 RepID=UPI0022554C37|nr:MULTISPECIES: DMT family transporter [Paraburkholderia]MCX4162836.1 DMT family transporter [Paraburkholderia megapolitana]MDN7158331.1 DMT family transporter [Paraburkholderia sp. CHISQ3]MDQ6495378.1 DMT family transporter [Paraburkholderia megapolitana]